MQALLGTFLVVLVITVALRHNPASIPPPLPPAQTTFYYEGSRLTTTLSHVLLTDTPARRRGQLRTAVKP